MEMLFAWIVLLAGVHASQYEEELLKSIFLKYNSAVRPVIYDADTVNVTFGLTLSQIIDVQEKNQILIISAFIRQIWNNPLLAWKPERFNGIKEINVNPNTIWRPDIVLYNNADEDKSFGGNLDRLKTRAILESNGKTTWLAPLILKSKCDINVRYFPFDTQRCPLKFGSWTYDKKRLDLLNESNTATLEKYSKNSEWYLSSAPALRNEEKYFCCPELYPDVTFTIVIARRSLFYLCNLIFPMTIIGMLTMLSFLLPAESGERVSLAITLLLAMTVFMLVVADIIPETSDVIPLVSIFFSVSMIEMVVMIIVLCYIMRLHHKGADDPPMPLWMKRFVLEWLSYAVRIRVANPEPSGFTPINNYFNNPKRNNEGHLLEKVTKKTSEHSLGVISQNSYQRKDDAQLMLNKIGFIVDKLRKMDEEDSVKTDWRIVAMTIDRCLLILFAGIYVVTLCGCFSMSPGYVS